MTIETKPSKIVDAYAEWDDPDAFRIFIFREDADESEPLQSFAWCERDSVEWRLHTAAWVGAAKAMSKATSEGRKFGWATDRKAAERVARVMKAELAAIAKGKPAKSLEAVQVAMMLAGVRK